MDVILVAILTSASAVFASSGFWAFLQASKTKQDSSTKLLMGLAYDKILYLASSYIKRGWISKSEYEDIYQYLVNPYLAQGGNGIVERIMKKVDSLPMHNLNEDHLIENIKKEGTHGN